MIIINKGDTPYDYSKDTFVIQDSIGKTLNYSEESIGKSQTNKRLRSLLMSSIFKKFKMAVYIQPF